MWWKTKCCYCGRPIRVEIPLILVLRNRDHLQGNACLHCVPAASILRNGIDESAWNTEEYKGVSNMTGKCAVCGKQTEVYVASSSIGAVTYAYCEDCLRAGAEPWSDLVFNCAICGPYPESVNTQFRETVRNTCRHLGKTEEEFQADVNEAILDWDDHMELFEQYDAENPEELPF